MVLHHVRVEKTSKVRGIPDERNQLVHEIVPYFLISAPTIYN